MKRILVVACEQHWGLYKDGILNYCANNDIVVNWFKVNFSKSDVGVIDKLKYKIDYNDYRHKYYESKRAKLCKLIPVYDEIIFYNLHYDKQWFIQGEVLNLLRYKKVKLFFVDTIRIIKENVPYWDIFDNIYSFEYGDIGWAKNNLGIDVEFLPVGSSYALFEKTIDCFKYDVCFVGMATKNRLVYLEEIAKYCYENNKKFFVAGLFWHSNNFLNYLIGEFKFKNKYPMLAQYVKNEYIEPSSVARIYSESKIVLNINMQFHYGFNQRNFDAMVCKSLLLCSQQNLDGIDLEDGKDFIMCRDVEDMLKSIDFYLREEKLRKNIVDRAYLKAYKKYLIEHTLRVLFN